MSRFTNSGSLTVDQCNTIDIWWLNAAGILKPGAVVREFPFNEELVDGKRRVFGVFVERDDGAQVRLMVGRKSEGAVIDLMILRIAVIVVVWRPNPLVRGQRPYMICPGCGTRVRKLFVPPQELDCRCRQCLGLTYACRRRDYHERSKRRAIQKVLLAANWDKHWPSLKTKEVDV
jgi:hypothetical protein